MHPVEVDHQLCEHQFDKFVHNLFVLLDNDLPCTVGGQELGDLRQNINRKSIERILKNVLLICLWCETTSVFEFVADEISSRGEEPTKRILMSY